VRWDSGRELEAIAIVIIGLVIANALAFWLWGLHG
jgi:hypothetical protein